MENEKPVVYVVMPEMIALSNRELIRATFGVAAITLRHWHETIGFPLVYPDGYGVGRRGYVPLRLAREWMKRRAMLNE